MLEVVDYGGGNLGSLQRCVQRLECAYQLVDRPSGNRPVVLPGVGAFGAVMEALQSSGCAERVKAVVQAGTPFLGICVGLQVLLEGSEESPGVPGLGLIAGRVVRFQAPKVPQVGWNLIRSQQGDQGYVYFVNSYYAQLQQPDDLWYAADYFGPFCAALQRGHISAFQFHPEKSGDYGQQLVADWVRSVN